MNHEETVADAAFIIGQYQADGRLSVRDSREWIQAAIEIAHLFDAKYPDGYDWGNEELTYIELLDDMIASELETRGFFKEEL